MRLKLLIYQPPLPFPLPPLPRNIGAPLNGPPPLPPRVGFILRTGGPVSVGGGAKLLLNGSNPLSPPAEIPRSNQGGLELPRNTLTPGPGELSKPPGPFNPPRLIMTL